MSVLEQILSAFGAHAQVPVNDLPADDPRAKTGKACEALLTGGVDALRSVIPSDRVRAIGRVIWDLVGNKQVLTAIGPEVPSLSFALMGYQGIQQGIILMPRDWPAKVSADVFMQLGAILFVGVQAVDFYNERIIGDPHAKERCQAYEAELLHALAGASTSWSPNTYQQDLMRAYPCGLDSAGEALYAYRGYEPPKGTT